MRLLIALAAILICAFPRFCFAQTIEPSNNFSNTWLLKPYYERLTKSDSICSAMNYSDFEIRRIYFNGKDSILNIGSLIEGNRESFIVKNTNELYIPKSAFFRNPFTLSLVTRDAKTFLVLYEIKESNKDSIFYVSLPKAYGTSNGFEHFINNKSFTGEYNHFGRKLKFFDDGRFEGLEDFNKYIVHQHTLTYFDIVTFQKKVINRITNATFEKIVKDKSYHWKKVGRDIWLYNLSDETPVAEVTTLFAKLMRVD